MKYGKSEWSGFLGKIVYNSNTKEYQVYTYQKNCDHLTLHRLYHAIGERCPCQWKLKPVGLNKGYSKIKDV